MTSPATKLVAIVNVTPDSFSDGGKHLDPDAAIAHIGELITQGADVIDIGAESTRPGATLLSHAQEWERLEPVLTRVAAKYPNAVISVDTRHPDTARKSLKLGVQWINDVSGFADPEMLKVVQPSSCKLVAMHSLSIPADGKQVIPDNTNVIEEVLGALARMVVKLEDAEIQPHRIILDPGIGFGKTAQQSYTLLQRIDKLHKLELPLMVGHSRKSFLSLFTDAPASERDEATLAISAYLAMRHVRYLRVHEIPRHRQLLNILGGLTAPPSEDMGE